MQTQCLHSHLLRIVSLNRLLWQKHEKKKVHVQSLKKLMAQLMMVKCYEFWRAVHISTLLCVLSPLSSNRATFLSLHAIPVLFTSVEQSARCYLATTRAQVRSWPGSNFYFFNNVFSFHRAYTLPSFINFNLQLGKTCTQDLWVGST